MLWWWNSQSFINSNYQMIFRMDSGLENFGLKTWSQINPKYFWFRIHLTAPIQPIIFIKESQNCLWDIDSHWWYSSSFKKLSSTLKVTSEITKFSWKRAFCNAKTCDTKELNETRPILFPGKIRWAKISKL